MFDVSKLGMTRPRGGYPHEPGCVAVRSGGELLVAIGRPAAPALESAFSRAAPGAELVASEEAVLHLGRLLDVPGKRAHIHRPGPDGLAHPPGLPEAVLLQPGRDLTRLPEILRGELEQRMGQTVVRIGVLVDNDQYVLADLASSLEWSLNKEQFNKFSKHPAVKDVIFNMPPPVAPAPAWGR